jgi:hypothetical protein
MEQQQYRKIINKRKWYNGKILNLKEKIIAEKVGIKVFVTGKNQK